MTALNLTLRAHGSAPVDEVWDRYRRPQRWPEWAPQIQRVRCDAEVIAPGAMGVVQGLLVVSVDFTVLEVNSDERTWSWEVHRGPVRLHLAHSVSDAAPGSSTSLVLRGFAPVVLAYAPLAQFALHRLVRGEG